MHVRDTLTALARRTHLLPAVMTCAALLLGCKLWLLVAAGGAPDALASAGRAVLPAARAAAEEPHVAPPAPATPSPANPSASAAQRAASSAPVGQPPPSPAEPPMPAMSDAERSLLQDLRSRRGALDAREAGMQQREAVLAAAEKRLAARVEELSALQARLETLEQGRRDRDEANWRGLVKTYETMRPRDAAAIFNDLDGPVLMQVLDRMKEAKAAPVLAAMQPERARAATADLAKWRSRSTTEPLPGRTQP